MNMNIEEVLETAHISISHATLKVVVGDLSKYRSLFTPRCSPIDDSDDPIYEEDPTWKTEMGFPSFVISVSPWGEDNTLSVWVEHPWDLKKLSNWLNTFETK